MSPEQLAVVDTAIKIGLGALIGAVSAIIVAKLQHRQAVEQTAVRRRLELIEEITAGVSEFGNLIARFCQLSENIYHAHYRQDSTVGDVPQSWIDERSAVRRELTTGRALEKPEGLMYLIAASDDGTLPIALSDLQGLAAEVMHAADESIEHFDIETVQQKLGEFKKQAAVLMVELGKVYRKPTI